MNKFTYWNSQSYRTLNHWQNSAKRNIIDLIRNDFWYNGIFANGKTYIMPMSLLSDDSIESTLQRGPWLGTDESNDTVRNTWTAKSPISWENLAYSYKFDYDNDIGTSSWGYIFDCGTHSMKIKTQTLDGSAITFQTPTAANGWETSTIRPDNGQYKADIFTPIYKRYILASVVKWNKNYFDSTSLPAWAVEPTNNVKSYGITVANTNFSNITFDYLYAIQNELIKQLSYVFAHSFPEVLPGFTTPVDFAQSKWTNILTYPIPYCGGLNTGEFLTETITNAPAYWQNAFNWSDDNGMSTAFYKPYEKNTAGQYVMNLGSVEYSNKQDIKYAIAQPLDRGYPVRGVGFDGNFTNNNLYCACRSFYGLIGAALREDNVTPAFQFYRQAKDVIGQTTPHTGFTIYANVYNIPVGFELHDNETIALTG